MAIALSGMFFANHNKKSYGQNCYHMVNKQDKNSNIGLVYRCKPFYSLVESSKDKVISCVYYASCFAYLLLFGN